MQTKVKYRVQSSSEGKFNLEKANEGLASAKLVRKCREKSPRIQTAIRIFEKSENSSNTTFSNMEHLKGTPVKCKKVFDGGGARTVGLQVISRGVEIIVKVRPKSRSVGKSILISRLSNFHFLHMLTISSSVSCSIISKCPMLN